MKVLITGANGFIGKNLRLFLREYSDTEILNFTKEDSIAILPELTAKVDFIFHLAGVNRANNSREFELGNEIFTQKLCDALKKINRRVPVVYTSSTQVKLKTPYGISKFNAENILLNLHKNSKIPVYIFRLPNVFGKWSKPNYNSVVSTFCNNIIRDIPISINDPEYLLNLVYIDDVIKALINTMKETNYKEEESNEKIDCKNFKFVKPLYQITVGDLAKQLSAFREMQNKNMLEEVGVGLIKNLYSTYISYLPKKKFSSIIKSNVDMRGRFVEILKSKNSGQFSYFTMLPGATRGNHYHHSKTEKFLVIKGKACFKFKNLDNSEICELIVCGDKPELVETIPGWAHNITNIGNDEMIATIWSNENFDPHNADTYFYEL